MIKIRLFIALFMLFCISTSQAQVIEKVVGITPVAYTRTTSNRDDALRLYNYILNAMQQTNRLKVIDRPLGGKHVVAELSEQTNSSHALGNVVKQGKQLGADYVFFTQVNTANVLTIKTKEGELKGYEGNLSIFVRVLSVETGEVVSTSVITPKGVTPVEGALEETLKLDANASKVGNIFDVGGLSDSPEEALRKSMEKMETQIRVFVDETFPLEMLIAKIEEVEHGKKTQTEVFILGGKLTGLRTGDNLIIKEIVERHIKEKIYHDEVERGKLKVIRVSQDLVVCKITDDSDLVLSIYEQKPDMLKVIFIPKSDVFGFGFTKGKK
ncbi:hypothetical protein R9C00_02380 [Flammeovirgaceae bacterium SG7u.111]|nr:hypothetical protein [Flammeovirgaceae bacterium SG7u.132]WPO36288.1 hypothetical protein R9C00_02380 [Flammeovirgaceae bacterium SG7u.111]